MTPASINEPVLLAASATSVLGYTLGAGAGVYLISCGGLLVVRNDDGTTATTCPHPAPPIVAVSQVPGSPALTPDGYASGNCVPAPSTTRASQKNLNVVPRLMPSSSMSSPPLRTGTCSCTVHSLARANTRARAPTQPGAGRSPGKSRREASGRKFVVPAPTGNGSSTSVKAGPPVRWKPTLNRSPALGVVSALIVHEKKS